MLISSLVSQPQLQEVRDIASDKSKGYVFATTDEINIWMEDQENVAKLAIGDNLYIVDKQVMDYWQDGTGLRAQETELPDMIYVMTILGAAIGGGNAITDLSFSGNTPIPAKIVHLQRLILVKLLQVKRHLIQLSTQSEQWFKIIITILFDQIDAYTKTQDDALLLLRADKTQLIDAQTKGEADNLLNSKANSGVSYIKGENNAQLFLKTNKTQLIDSYTIGETNNLLNNKADSGVSQTKGEDDALLLLKADKTQLIDAYIKGEADNLLNNNADSGVSYTRGEDDALLLLKANHSTICTKKETDYLIFQIEVGDVDSSGYMTLGTAQTINANKTFNNAC
ncbi:MAG: hypothetical protein EZS28_035175 [Streblomastix strix]|uniref:Uncharacterized protein n=1 Tax=Streblomastix strix TaxID=222440 RepID=A0A5J4UF74_9EUKA|nr:MAG: hypothetical protein EZS28_035175 [Streblomastix strix]